MCYAPIHADCAHGTKYSKSFIGAIPLSHHKSYLALGWAEISQHPLKSPEFLYAKCPCFGHLCTSSLCSLHSLSFVHLRLMDKTSYLLTLSIFLQLSTPL